MLLSALIILLSNGTMDTTGNTWIDLNNVTRLIIIGAPDTIMDHLTDEERE